jgi:two-component system chemotaxis response regulator CheB
VRYVEVDHVLSATQIGEFIATPHADQKQGVVVMSRDNKEPEPQDPAQETDIEEMNDRFGNPTGLTCPDCGGALWEIEAGELPRYRCHVGHQFTVEGLDAEEQDAVESALWSAVRVLEEHAELRHRMATRAEAAGMAAISSGFAYRALESKQQAHTIRALLFSRALPDTPNASQPRPAKRSTKGPARGSNGKGRKARRQTR